MRLDQPPVFESFWLMKPGNCWAQIGTDGLHGWSKFCFLHGSVHRLQIKVIQSKPDENSINRGKEAKERAARSRSRKASPSKQASEPVPRSAPAPAPAPVEVVGSPERVPEPESWP